MHFGLTNAPITFLDIKNQVCRPMLDRPVIVFIDDTMIYSNTKEQHEEYLHELLGVLRSERLYVKFSKSELWLREV